MPGPVLILIVFTTLLALCGVLAYWRGFDSREGFADQAHSRFRS